MNVTHPLRVGSWPGPRFSHNPFIQHFCQSLSDCGIEVIDVADPRKATVPFDVLHIHWPEQVFWNGGLLHRVLARLVVTIDAIRRLKRGGVSVVWTVHNLRPHDLKLHLKPLWSFYLSQLCELTDGFVTLSPSTVDVVRRNIRGLRHKPAIYAWHPPYPYRPAPQPRPELRQKLQINPDSYLFGFLGLLRPYKGIEELIAAFRAISGGGYALVIAGEAIPPSYVRKIRRRIDGDARIRLDARGLTDDEYSSIGGAADALVFPFRNILHSGSLVHAVSQRNVALTPETPFATDLRRAVGGEWVQTYRPPLTSEILLSVKPTAGTPRLDALARSESGVRLADFYRRIIEIRKRSSAVSW